jgi:hypothetical protein
MGLRERAFHAAELSTKAHRILLSGSANIKVNRERG